MTPYYMSNLEHMIGYSNKRIATRTNHVAENTPEGTQRKVLSQGKKKDDGLQAEEEK